MRNDGFLETKEAATDALLRWQNTRAKATEAGENAVRSLADLRTEQSGLAAEATQLSAKIAAGVAQMAQIEKQVSAAEKEEERIATHEQTRAAIEASRADPNLPQTAERLSERAAALLAAVRVE